jgi:hypothetical protein
MASSLHRHYPASPVLRASPPPHTALPDYREFPVDRYTITAGVSRVASGLLCVHAVAITPAGPVELVRSFLSTVSGLPCVTVRSAPAIIVSGTAQRSLALRPARSRSRHATLSTESSDSFVASTAASIATRWSEPVPERELHPLKSNAFHGALVRQPGPAPVAEDTIAIPAHVAGDRTQSPPAPRPRALESSRAQRTEGTAAAALHQSETDRTTDLVRTVAEANPGTE